MIREIIIPKKRDYVLSIPEEYLNRKVEILVLPMDNDQMKEKCDTHIDIVKMTSGILKDKKIDPLRWQRNIRADWDSRS